MDDIIILDDIEPIYDYYKEPDIEECKKFTQNSSEYLTAQPQKRKYIPLGSGWSGSWSNSSYYTEVSTENPSLSETKNILSSLKPKSNPWGYPLTKKKYTSKYKNQYQNQYQNHDFYGPSYASKYPGYIPGYGPGPISSTHYNPGFISSQHIPSPYSNPTSYSNPYSNPQTSPSYSKFPTNFNYKNMYKK
jgi:hypothetical protein